MQALGCGPEQVTIVEVTTCQLSAVIWMCMCSRQGSIRWLSFSLSCWTWAKPNYFTIGCDWHWLNECVNCSSRSNLCSLSAWALSYWLMLWNLLEMEEVLKWWEPARFCVEAERWQRWTVPWCEARAQPCVVSAGGRVLPLSRQRSCAAGGRMEVSERNKWNLNIHIAGPSFPAFRGPTYTSDLLKGNVTGIPFPSSDPSCDAGEGSNSIFGAYFRCSIYCPRCCCPDPLPKTTYLS